MDPPLCREAAGPALNVEAKMNSTYLNQIFILVEAPSRIVSTHKIKEEKEYNDLIKTAKNKKLCLYKADVIHTDGRYFAVQPWSLVYASILPDSKNRADNQDVIINIAANSGVTEAPKSKDMTVKSNDTRPNDATEIPKSNGITANSAPNLTCQYCGKVMTSTPGRTLHVKSKHPEKFQEYAKQHNN